MLKNISAKQQKVLDFYKEYVEEHDCSPTYQQASELLGVSPSVVYSHIVNLEKAGHVHRDSSGGIQFENKTQQMPVLGAIACGEPLEVVENIEDYLDIPANLIKHGTNYYALVAKGESMIQA